MPRAFRSQRSAGFCPPGLAGLALAASLACYQSSAWMEGDGDVGLVPESPDHSDGRDAPTDLADRGADAPDASWDDGGVRPDGRDGAVDDTVLPDGEPEVTGRLVPEDEGTIYETESGRDATIVSCQGQRCAAFSGAVYGVILDENTPWDEDSEFTAVYRLAPGGTVLGTSWIDTTAGISLAGSSICWTGDAFLAALETPTLGGTRVLTVAESGELLTGPRTVPTDAEGLQLFCPPNAAPFLVEGWRGGTPVVRPLERDGSGGEETIAVALPAREEAQEACTDTRDVGVCASGDVLVFIGRDGLVDVSDPVLVPPSARASRQDVAVAFTGDAVAVVWAADPSGAGKLYLYYALVGLDGRVITPATAVVLGWGMVAVGSAGPHNLVLYAPGGEPGGRPEGGPQVLLLDRNGTALDASMPFSSMHDIFFWPVMGVFWEGDAYGVLWNTWPEEFVLYRRFFVEG